MTWGDVVSKATRAIYGCLAQVGRASMMGVHLANECIHSWGDTGFDSQ